MTNTRVLILGGTEFVGRAFVDEALGRGHDVTVLNRGSRAPLHGVTTLVGDRTAPGGLDALNSSEAGAGTWDLVVDTWSWGPRAVRDAAALLSSRADRFVYVSSRSVHEYPAPAYAREDAPVVDASADDTGFDDYARAKRGGELGALAGFGDRALLLRAGLILGPRENIGRLPWWLTRIARGGPVVAPGPADACIQYVDARDLAAFGLDATVTGPVNVVSPPDVTTMRDFLYACIAATGSDAELRWFTPEQLEGVEPWMELPVWIPQGLDFDGMHRGDVTAALAAGLTIRPLAETVGDTWDWLQSIGGVAPQRPDRPVLGLPTAKEARLLAGP
ncbi:nucleoside-diphosphate-sugar epimerase [Conyzicola lurida]|uniref:Nucleoside-diphosphate-sugar epimerase n=1 Tax=Conyzicola lurida TaxID=1172621 RepID=A0A841AQW4_9MICO|nr:NAD-dependent epimerase/dehydratase family protein [Conyzicola lurida]MBB5843965.1 nucleoside-diphosphate-sugar epimerase [Conyzicola lurida]